MTPLPRGPFNIIYADSPWTFRVWSDKGKGRSPEYQVMRLPEIQALPVREIAARDCCLFLWATYPLLPEALATMAAWGFAYKTVAFTWVKTCRKSPEKLHTGLGYWTRSNAEICLLGTRGKPQRVSRSVHSVIISPVREHSRKPDEARTRIVQLLGDLPRIELFTRQYTPGWPSMGR